VQRDTIMKVTNKMQLRI